VHHSSNEAIALAARSLIRLSRLTDALTNLEAGLQHAGELSHHDRGQLQALRATTLARLGRPLDAQRAFDEARAYVFSASCPDLEAEYHHFEAHAKILNGDIERCEEACSEVLAPAVIVYGARPHFTPLAHARARAFDLLAVIAANRRNYSVQQTYLKRSFEEMDHCAVRDEWFKSTQLASLAMLARESGDRDDADYVRARLDSIDWVEELAPQRYELLRSLGWASALCGDHLGAFRDLRAAAEAAPSIPLKIEVSLDRTYLARELRQELTAREELDHAERLSESVHWESGSRQDCDVLLRLSEALAPESPTRARRLYRRYRALRGKLREHASHFDERARLDETTADATICRAEGNTNRATLLFHQAFELWKELGYSWRAGLAAIELAELGAGDEFAELALAEADRHPNSWFAQRARALRSPAPH
jgi:tetratricopeptide (TPR) repeat protein